MQTFADVIKKTAKSSKNKLTFYNLQGEKQVYRYKEMYESACRLLYFMKKQGIKKGDKVVFQLSNNYDFVNGIWACLLGGYIAVPIPCSEKSLDVERIIKVMSGMDEAVILCSQNTLRQVEAVSEKIEGKVKTLLQIEDGMSSDGKGIAAAIEPDDIAMIQFSSGSTSDPKGVVITHSALLANVNAISEHIELKSSDRVCQWIPLTHDMGLIGGHFTAVFFGCGQYLMETAYFLKNPLGYLKEVSENDISILVLPNFGLQYILQSIQSGKEEEFDFSAIRIIFNGAEPISLDICRAFNQVMSKYHLGANTIFTVYGLAEATLAVAFPKLNTPIQVAWVNRHNMEMGERVEYLSESEKKDAIPVVSEGSILTGLHCQIRDDENKMLPEDYFGQIFLKGTSIMKEYYNNEAMTKQKFTEDGWLKTGDLGFIHEKQLYVLGRQEELIIVNGQNYLSYDLENILYGVDCLKKRKLAVLSVLHPVTKSNSLVCVVQKTEDTEELSGEVKEAVKKHFYEQTGLLLDEILERDKIPLTTSKKIKRKVLQGMIEKELEPEQLMEAASLNSSNVNLDDVELQLQKICMELVPGFDKTSSFKEMEISSILVTKLHQRINQVYPNSIGIEELFKVQELSELTKKIKDSYQKKERDWQWNRTQDIEEVAIVGMALKVPGADNLSEFWENIKMGVESIGEFPPKRRTLYGMQSDCEIPRGGYLEEIDTFDNRFFGVIDREAIAMPPSQRIFLQTAYEAFEDAGYPMDKLKDSRTGVYVGYISDTDNVGYQQLLKQSDGTQTATGALSANISGRVSYTFDLKGESCNIDSACSSSGTALYHAYQSICRGECDMAIAGGIQIELMPSVDKNIGIESKEGHIRSFDNQADGTCKGEGSVAVVIKPYKKALEDNDHVYAIISSMTMNQDGRTKGLSVPNPDSQESLIVETIKKAGIRPKDIQYFETHGTGTNIGDPIELNTIAKVFVKEDKEVCYVGSVKPNIGHLYAASGLAGVIKCCKMLEEGTIPKLINFSQLNDKINMERASLVINTENQNWNCETRRRCLVNNFGFSGTNFNLLLSEAEQVPCNDTETEQKYMFVISAKTRQAFYEMIEKYRIFTIDTEESIANICYTSLLRREHFEYRAAFLVSSVSELHNKLMGYTGKIDFQEDIYCGHVHTRAYGQQLAEQKLSFRESELLENLCREKMKAYVECPDLNHLRKLAELYIKGANGEWSQLFKYKAVHNVSLPSYAFEKKHFWPQPRKTEGGAL